MAVHHIHVVNSKEATRGKALDISSFRKFEELSLVQGSALQLSVPPSTEARAIPMPCEFRENGSEIYAKA